MTTPVDVTTRIVSILTAHSAFASGDVVDEYPTNTILSTQLPYGIVTSGRATSIETINNKMLKVSREFYIEVFKDIVTETERQYLRELKDASTLLSTLIMLFASKNRLQHNDAGLNGVVSSVLEPDSGVGYGSYNGQHLYTGFILTLNITYHQQVEVTY